MVFDLCVYILITVYLVYLIILYSYWEPTWLVCGVQLDLDNLYLNNKELLQVEYF